MDPNSALGQSAPSLVNSGKAKTREPGPGSAAGSPVWLFAKMKQNPVGGQPNGSVRGISKPTGTYAICALNRKRSEETVETKEACKN